MSCYFVYVVCFVTNEPPAVFLGAPVMIKTQCFLICFDSTRISTGRTVAAIYLCQVQHWEVSRKLSLLYFLFVLMQKNLQLIALQESMTASFDTLSKLGEKPLQDMSNATLKADMLSMNEILRSMSDDSILNMQAQKKNKKLIATLNLYANLAHVLHPIKPSLICAVSLRMIEITFKNGLGPSSPLSFVHYGGVLVALGNVHEGCRLGMYHMLPGQSVI